MKTLVRTAIATTFSVALMLLFAAITRWRAEQYVVHGWDMPLSFRVQIGISAYLYRFWWLLAPFIAGAWGIIFLIVHAIGGNKAHAAAASTGASE